MNIIDEIKALKAKKEQAQTLLTKHRTQLESLSEQRDRLIEELQDKYDVTLETADATIAKMSEELQSKLDEARKTLDKIEIN